MASNDIDSFAVVLIRYYINRAYMTGYCANARVVDIFTAVLAVIKRRRQRGRGHS